MTESNNFIIIVIDEVWLIEQDHLGTWILCDFLCVKGRYTFRLFITYYNFVYASDSLIKLKWESINYVKKRETVVEGGAADWII